MKADLEILDLEFKELLQQTDPDRSAVGKKITEMGELKTKMKKDHIMARLNARSVLTKEQLEKCMGGQCGCLGMKKVIEHKSCSESSSEKGKDCSGHCR